MQARRDWVALLAEQAHSELTQAAFCKQHGIYAANLRRARLRQEVQAARTQVATAPPPPTPTPAPVPTPTPASAASVERFVRAVPVPALPRVPSAKPPLELAFRSLTLRFAPSTPPAVVAALVKALT